jgi:nitrile hydratase accessory protein
VSADRGPTSPDTDAVVEEISATVTRDPVVDSAELAELSLLPRDASGPVFAEPWQAQAFAVVVELLDSGVVTREEWAAELGATLAAAEARGETDTGERYYDHWLATLERIVVEKDIAVTDELVREAEAISASDHHRRENQLHGSHAHGHHAGTHDGGGHGPD